MAAKKTTVAKGVAKAREEEAPTAKVVAERFSRFSGIIDPEVIKTTPVILVGCGGIGAWVAMMLACLGSRLTVFDFDKTREHNFGGQPLPDVGRFKVMQVRDMMKHLGEIRAVPQKFDKKLAEKYGDARIWTSGVDSIESREVIWEAAKERHAATGLPEWYVDGRMGGTQSHVLTIQMSDAEARANYEKSLKPEGGFTPDACAMRSTVFAGSGCASEMVSEVALILQGKGKSRQRNTEWLSGQVIEGWTR